MATCKYRHCRNETEAGSEYCEVHDQEKPNRKQRKTARRKTGVVPDRKTQVNSEADERFADVKTWIEDAKRHIRAFLACNDVDDWLSLFFGGTNVEDCKATYNQMIVALDRWKRGERKICVDHTFTTTGAANAVNQSSGELSLNPNCFDADKRAENPWVLVHESAHGAYVGNNAKYIVDLKYHFQGKAAFIGLTNPQRLKNADHFRICTEFCLAGKSLEECEEYRGADDAGTGPAPLSRTVSAGNTYASMIRKGASLVFAVFRLQAFDYCIQAPGLFHQNKGKMSGMRNYGHRTQISRLIPDKDSKTFKAKDWVRLKQLQTKAFSWEGSVDRAQIVDVFDDGLSKPSVDSPGLNYQVHSGMQNDDVVTDRQLADGVKALVEELVKNNPYSDFNGDLVLKAVKDSYRPERPQWFRHLA